MSPIPHQKIPSCVLLVALAVVLLPGVLCARSHVHYGDGFSIDLDSPYETVVKVLESVAADGIVRGTGEYKGTHDLLGAVPVKSSDAFKNPAEDGKVFYKVRGNSIAPDHFDNSNDEGTVTVRYVVRALGPKATRLWIDAIFVEDSHHHRHLSDGTVENAEFLAISDTIKGLEEQEAKRKQEETYAKQQAILSGLQEQIEQEKTQLTAAKLKQQELEKKIASLRGGRAGHIRTETAALKAGPYLEAKTVQALAKGDAVTVLLRTRSWYEVQTSSGAQGWVYGLMIEVE